MDASFATIGRIRVCWWTILHQLRQPVKEGGSVHCRNCLHRRSLHIDASDQSARLLEERTSSPTHSEASACTCACNAFTAAKSALPFVCVRPMTHTISVGDLISFIMAGSVPVQRGPVIAKSRLAGSSGPLSRRGEHVGPPTQHLHQVIAPMRIRNAQDNWLLLPGQATPRNRSIRIRAHHIGKRGVRKRRHTCELIHRRCEPVADETFVILARLTSMITNGYPYT